MALNSSWKDSLLTAEVFSRKSQYVLEEINKTMVQLTNPAWLPIQISVSFLVTVVFPTFYFFLRKSRKRAESAVKIEVIAPEEAKPHWKGKRLNPVSIRNPDEPAFIQSYCPATGQYLGKFKSSTTEDIDTAIALAAEAQQKFALTSFKERRKVLRTLNQFICDNQEIIARVACRDSGKTMVDASMGEILVTLEKINWILKNGEKSLKTSTRPGPSNLLMSYKRAEVRYEPLGVVAALVSWNYPFHNLMGPVIASIFTGNALLFWDVDMILILFSWCAAGQKTLII
ncbi:unnamed protein product [Kuraishia capsulata CBS 1993]|uniref:Aldehyde dehydrogenase domain-containing protein n=1 Tax=Kuraishia capsulata CBS 1993 TaxID=1382522 RepID=W6MGM7_9ASCO|nr:uncharacterized protein KUCA_T00000953001 [Kuraishia capsulata CBS 1993]CDK24986.1 unnamed protein product [Kuraishia capsulata CBS 1993]